jgi:integrase
MKPTLRDAMREMYTRRIDLARRTLKYLEHTVNAFEKWNRGPVLLEALCDDLILLWLSALKDSGKAARTVNSLRMGVLVIWREAFRMKMVDSEPGKIPRLRVPKRAATAWTVEEVSRMLQHCDAGLPNRWSRSKATWRVEHWQALILVIFDTSQRINALLAVPRRCADLERGVLLIPGEFVKNGQDQRHRLHAQTCDLIRGLPESINLFPWPKHRRAIWRDFRKILFAAGLPCTYRDFFHKLRRTSYSMAYRYLGPAGASAHAGHGSDLSETYLDRTLLDLPCLVDLMPRPSIAAENPATLPFRRREGGAA